MSSRSVQWFTAHREHHMVRTQRQEWTRGWIGHWTMVLGLAVAALFLHSAPALGQTTQSVAEGRAKLSSDLQGALSSPSVAGVSWARETAAGRMVKVLVIGSPQVDPDLVYLRRAITAAGGSV